MRREYLSALAYLYKMTPPEQDALALWDYAVLIDDADGTWLKVAARGGGIG